jgi:hypothetical protein
VGQVGDVGVRRVSFGIAGVAIASFARPGVAQEIQLTGPLAGAPATRSLRSPNPGSKLTDEFLLPSGQLEVGDEVVFLTGDAARQRELELTDVGLLRLRVRRAAPP